MSNANKEYSDRLFHFLFGREERKGWTLSLYNAVRGSAYTDKDDIQINTIDEILYLGMHNDISFLKAGEMNLFEQQSSFNPNMPLRMLQYIAKLYAGYNKKIIRMFTEAVFWSFLSPNWWYSTMERAGSLMR